MRLTVLAPLALVAAACTIGGGSAPSPSSPASPEPSASAGSGALPEDVAGSWQLIGIGDAAIDAMAIPTLEVTETGAVSGSAGCNQFSGTVVVSPDEIRFGPLATTKMACADPANALESRYLVALSAARTWMIDGEGNLVIEGGERLVYQPHP